MIFKTAYLCAIGGKTLQTVNKGRHAAFYLDGGAFTSQGFSVEVAQDQTGGGGGVSANERAEELRTKAFAQKLDQIDEIGDVELIVIPCANCRGVFEDGLDAYERDYEVIGLGELVAETLKE